MNSADSVNPDWSLLVYSAFHQYLQQQPDKFQAEDFREWLGDRIPAPPSKRAFGGIITRAVRAGIIKHVGYARVKNPKAHQANSAVWMRV